MRTKRHQWMPATALFLTFCIGLTIQGAWDATKPADTRTYSLRDDDIRTNNTALESALGYEHLFTGTTAANQTGGHLEGSARGYYAASQPTTKPDGSTSLDSDDDGRIWIDTNDSMWYYTGTGWQAVGANDVNVSIGDYISADEISETEIELSNDAWLVASNAAGTGDVNLIKANTNDECTLPDGAELETSGAPTEDEDIANKKYVDDQISAQGFAYSGQTVFGASTMGAAATFQDLDLSAYVGENRALVYLQIYVSNGNDNFAAKPKGLGGTWPYHAGNTAYANGAGCSVCGIDSTEYRYVTVMTDGSGVIQIGAGQSYTIWTITLVCYVK